jgi:hypothetical protein
MTTVETATTARAALHELAGLLRCRDGLGVIAGARGRITQTAGGIIVEVGPTASLAMLLQLVQAGVLNVAETFMLARCPTEAEAAMLRELCGIKQGTI